MNIYETAKEVLSVNQEAVVFFTHGMYFQVDSLGNGYTGNWVVDPENLENVDKVIIYLRRDDESVNRIFLGNFAGSRRSSQPGRYEIRFTRLDEVGTTQSNWKEFIEGGQNPVGYVTCRNC